ncbi:MAG: ABC-2 transporter permease [Verrucomicrobiae bacterium]|nr:ABC-2 transporter permease [Verrucomicrobiae bacterium]
MTGALIRKELRQHWWAMLLIGLLSVLGVGWIILLTVMQGQAGSQLFALRLHAWLLALSALVLGNRLVVAEYSSKTQIFLESLPLPRLRIVLVKYFLGFIIMFLCAGIGLGVAMLVGARTEVFTLRFVGILLARYFCYTAFVYSCFFGMGFLGRYRFAAYAIIVAGIALLVRSKDVALHELAPVYLVGGTFPFEREVYPTEALLITGGIALGFFLLAIILAATREGSVSSLLGERMSYRDKISLTALCFGLLVTFFVIDERKEKDPYQMAGGVSAEDTRLAEVTVAPVSKQARALAADLGKDLDEMAEYLGLTEMPPIFLIDRPDLDPDQFEHGYVADAEGVILRTPFTHEDWRYAQCVERISGDIIESATNSRAMKEDRFWVIDGFTLYWPHRGDPEAPLDKDHHLLLRALYGTDILGGLKNPDDLLQWFAHQRVVGHEITSGIGWSMLRVLEQQAGPEAAQSFMRSVLAEQAPKNALTSLRELKHPASQRFRDHTGLELSAFLDTWNAELDVWRKKLADEVAEIPRLSGDLVFEGEAGATSQARYRFEPPAAEFAETYQRPVLLFGDTAPFSVWLPEEIMKRQPLSKTELSEGWLVDTWGSGTGVAWTFAADSPQMYCRIISGWNHAHVP